MSQKTPRLWLHTHVGREPGLMIIGSKDALQSLAKQLLANSEEKASSAIDKWPTLVASPEIEGPFKDCPDFSLSFHLEGSTPANELFPSQRRSIPLWVFLVVTCLSVVGASTIIRWGLMHV